MYDEESLLIDNDTGLDDVFTRLITVHELVHLLPDCLGEADDCSCETTFLRNACCAK